jgi:hypothetical protein
MASTGTVATAAGAGSGRGVPAAKAASRRFRLDLSKTPGRLRLLLGILVLLSLAWGALAAFTVNQYSSAASNLVAVREPLSLDARQIYHDLSDANDTAATAFLAGGLEPTTTRQRYLTDIQAAGTLIETASAQGGATLGGASKDLATLSTDLPIYTGEVEMARADNRQGFPLGAAYLREASSLMNLTLLPAADDMYAAENASLTATSAQATGLPFVIATIAVGLGIVIAVAWVSRWLRRRTHRVLNAGLLLAGAVAVIALAWLAFAYSGARGDLLTAQSRGSAPAEALAKADITALQAHADESITLIDNGGDQNGADEKAYQREKSALGPGPGTLLTAAETAATGSQASGGATAAVRDAQAWYAAHVNLRKLDNNANHTAAVGSALGSGPGSGPGDARTAYTNLSGDFVTGIAAGQATFAVNASAGADAFAGLEPGVIAAALVMAVGCAWGLSRRLAEYR